MHKPVPKLPISSARSRVAAIKGVAYMPASGVFLMCTRDPDICLPICPEAKWRLVTRVLGLGQIVGTLDDANAPDSAKLQYQDWFTEWTNYPLTDAEEETLIKYAQQFYFDL